MKTNVIELREYRKPEPFDYRAYNERAAKRYRRAAVCQIIRTVLESLCAVTLLGCLLLGAVVLTAFA